MGACISLPPPAPAAASEPAKPAPSPSTEVSAMGPAVLSSPVAPHAALLPRARGHSESRPTPAFPVPVLLSAGPPQRLPPLVPPPAAVLPAPTPIPPSILTPAIAVTVVATVATQLPGLQPLPVADTKTDVLEPPRRSVQLTVVRAVDLPKGIQAKWQRFGSIAFYKSKEVDEIIESLWNAPVRASEPKSAATFFASLSKWCSDQQKSCSYLIVGGAVRDAVRGISGNDIDLSTSVSHQDMVNFCKQKGIQVSVSEGKYVGIDAQNVAEHLKKDVVFDTFLHSYSNALEPTYHDFRMNSILYDREEKLIIDRSGLGVTDAVNDRVRMTVDSSKSLEVQNWHHNLNALFRFFSFYERGFLGLAHEEKVIISTIDRLWRSNAGSSMSHACLHVFKKYSIVRLGVLRAKVVSAIIRSGDNLTDVSQAEQLYEDYWGLTLRGETEKLETDEKARVLSEQLLKPNPWVVDHRYEFLSNVDYDGFTGRKTLFHDIRRFLNNELHAKSKTRAARAGATPRIPNLLHVGATAVVTQVGSAGAPRAKNANLQRILVVLGEPGIGKSSAAAQIICHNYRFVPRPTPGQSPVPVNRLSADARITPDCLLGYYLCVERIESTIAPKSFVQLLVVQLIQTVPGFGSALIKSKYHDHILACDVPRRALMAVWKVLSMCPPKPESPATREVPKPSTVPIPPSSAADTKSAASGTWTPTTAAAVAPAIVNRYIIVDGLDESLYYNPPNLSIASIMCDPEVLCEMPAWLRIVTFSRNENGVLKQFASDSPQILQIRANEAENLADVAAYLRLQFKGHARPTVETVIAKCAGNFLVASELVKRVKKRRSDDDRKWVLHGLIEVEVIELQKIAIDRELRTDSLASYYALGMKRIRDSTTRKETWPAIRIVFETLIAARRPVQAKQLLFLVQLCTRRDIPDLEALNMELASVRSFLNGSITAKEPRPISIYHKSFKDWLLSRPDLVNVQLGHLRLAGCSLLQTSRVDEKYGALIMERLFGVKASKRAVDWPATRCADDSKRPHSIESHTNVIVFHLLCGGLPSVVEWRDLMDPICESEESPRSIGRVVSRSDNKDFDFLKAVSARANRSDLKSYLPNVTAPSKSLAFCYAPHKEMIFTLQELGCDPTGALLNRIRTTAAAEYFLPLLGQTTDTAAVKYDVKRLYDQSYGYPVLHYDIEPETDESLLFMRWMCENDVDVNAPSPYHGWLPLHLQVLRGRVNYVKWLVSFQADLNLRTADGDLVILYCPNDEKRDAELIQFLLDNGKWKLDYSDWIQLWIRNPTIAYRMITHDTWKGETEASRAAAQAVELMYAGTHVHLNSAFNKTKWKPVPHLPPQSVSTDYSSTDFVSPKNSGTETPFEPETPGSGSSTPFPQSASSPNLFQLYHHAAPSATAGGLQPIDDGAKSAASQPSARLNSSDTAASGT